MKTSLLIILFVVIFLFGLFIGNSLSEDKIIEVKDTVFVEQPKEIIVQKAKIKKIKVPQYIPVYFRDTITSGTDTVFVRDTVRIAEADTCFAQGCLNTKYYFPPYNYFEYKWEPFPTPEIQSISYTEPKWYYRKETWGLIGFVGGFYLGIKK